MSLLQADATVDTLHRFPTLEREHLIRPSTSGRRFCVLELEARCLDPEAGEAGWEQEVFEVSGWRSRVGAESLLRSLDGRWLTEASKQRMRGGEVVSVGDLRWTS